MTENAVSSEFAVFCNYNDGIGDLNRTAQYFFAGSSELYEVRKTHCLLGERENHFLSRFDSAERSFLIRFDAIEARSFLKRFGAFGVRKNSFLRPAANS